MDLKSNKVEKNVYQIINIIILFIREISNIENTVKSNINNMMNNSEN